MVNYGRSYEWKGQEMSLTAICQMEHVSYTGVKTRVLNGMSLEESIYIGKKKNRTVNRYTIEYEGKRWSVPDLAAYLGINKNRLYDAVRKAKNTGIDQECTFKVIDDESE